MEFNLKKTFIALKYWIDVSVEILAIHNKKQKE
jgi:hypothetical protein